MMKVTTEELKSQQKAGASLYLHWGVCLLDPGMRILFGFRQIISLLKAVQIVSARRVPAPPTIPAPPYQGPTFQQSFTCTFIYQVFPIRCSAQAPPTFKRLLLDVT